MTTAGVLEVVERILRRHTELTASDLEQVLEGSKQMVSKEGSYKYGSTV